MKSGKLISDSYREQNRMLHQGAVKFGQRGHMWAGTCRSLLETHDGSSVLDYGCGKASLSKIADFIVVNYDPAIEVYARDPASCDIVLCTDVLEHIEPQYLGNVLRHIRSKMIKAGYFSINTEPDRSKLLPDGTNPHKIIEDQRWWRGKIKEHFTIISETMKGNHYICEVI